GAGRVRHEDGDTVGNRHGQGETAPGGDVSVRCVDAEPSFPTIAVGHDPRAVHLIRGCESRAAPHALLPELAPSLHNDAGWLVRHQTEGSRGARGRERADTERRE